MDDLDGQLGDLRTRSLDPGDIEEIPDVGHKAKMVDPDGNVIWFAQLEAG